MSINVTVFDWDDVVGDMSMVNSGSVVSIFAICKLVFFVIFPAASSALTQT